MLKKVCNMRFLKYKPTRLKGILPEYDFQK